MRLYGNADHLYLALGNKPFGAASDMVRKFLSHVPIVSLMTDEVKCEDGRGSCNVDVMIFLRRDKMYRVPTKISSHEDG